MKTAEHRSCLRWNWRMNGLSNNKYKILVVEDDDNIRSLIETVLETNGYQTIPTYTCQMAKTLFASHNPDLAVLDLGLPDGDGLAFVQFVRQTSRMPIIVVSARDSEQDKVQALDLGANDYMTKPFGNAELLARIRAALRSFCQGTGANASDGIFYLRDMQIDYGKRRVTMEGQEVNLTQTEYNIVAFLSQTPGKVLTYAAIIKAVWGFPDMGSVKKLQVNMANIRKKMGIRPGENRYIINELGVGYRMQDETEE